MNRYSCRFECTEDYTRFIISANNDNVLVCTSELHHVYIGINEYPIPDCDVEFTCDADLERVRNIMRKLDDMHVGIQSLRPVPLKDNSLNRDYDIA